MNILMFTNTYTPHVGGVARSVERFRGRMREHGHRVVVVSPEFPDQPEQEEDVIRIPAIQNFNGSDFSLSLPVLFLDKLIEKDFKPDIIHSHHPYLLGDTGLRASAKMGVPLVFTHHTMYEKYTHYVPGDSTTMQHFVIELSTGYANMCDRVIAPSESVKDILRERGVETPVEVIPTGVVIEDFQTGDGQSIRNRMNIPRDAYVIGHLGRLAPEKNLEFLTRAVTAFLKENGEAHFLVVGEGPSEGEMARICEDSGLAGRLHFTGSLTGQEVADAYHAMDVFAFASKTETQGMVLTEAMAAGVPVVALDASGAREVVRDRENGRLLPDETEEEFSKAIEWVRHRQKENPKPLQEAVQQTARDFSLEACTRDTLNLYTELLGQKTYRSKFEEKSWDRIRRLLEQEWHLWSNRFNAMSTALSREEEKEKEKEDGG